MSRDIWGGKSTGFDLDGIVHMQKIAHVLLTGPRRLDQCRVHHLSIANYMTNTGNINACCLFSVNANTYSWSRKDKRSLFLSSQPRQIKTHVCIFKSSSVWLTSRMLRIGPFNYRSPDLKSLSCPFKLHAKTNSQTHTMQRNCYLTLAPCQN